MIRRQCKYEKKLKVTDYTFVWFFVMTHSLYTKMFKTETNKTEHVTKGTIIKTIRRSMSVVQNKGDFDSQDDNTNSYKFRYINYYKKWFLRAGFEPATYGLLLVVHTDYSPPLYQLSYQRCLWKLLCIFIFINHFVLSSFYVYLLDYFLLLSVFLSPSNLCRIPNIYIKSVVHKVLTATLLSQDCWQYNVA